METIGYSHSMLSKDDTGKLSRFELILMNHRRVHLSMKDLLKIMINKDN